MSLDMEALLAAAAALRKVHPGPYRAWPEENGQGASVTDATGAMLYEAEGGDYTTRLECEPAVAQYLATLDPDTLVALLDRETARNPAELEALELPHGSVIQELDGWHSYNHLGRWYLAAPGATEPRRLETLDYPVEVCHRGGRRHPGE